MNKSVRPRNSNIISSNCDQVAGDVDKLISLNNEFNELLKKYNESAGQDKTVANKLQDLGKTIQKTLDCMYAEDSETAAQIKYKKAMISQFLKNLRDERLGFNKNRRLLEKQRAMSAEDHRAYIASNYQMMAWGLVAVTVAGLFIKQL